MRIGNLKFGFAIEIKRVSVQLERWKMERWKDVEMGKRKGEERLEAGEEGKMERCRDGKQEDEERLEAGDRALLLSHDLPGIYHAIQ